MTNLESTRPGWIGRALGVAWILLAIGLTIWDLLIPTPWWFFLINAVTLTCGVMNFRLGTVRIRNACRHHEFMEEQRRAIRGMSS